MNKKLRSDRCLKCRVEERFIAPDSCSGDFDIPCIDCYIYAKSETEIAAEEAFFAEAKKRLFELGRKMPGPDWQCWKCKNQEDCFGDGTFAYDCELDCFEEVDWPRPEEDEPDLSDIIELYDQFYLDPFLDTQEEFWDIQDQDESI